MVEISQPEHIILTLYDSQGYKIRKIVDEDQPAGRHRYTWNGRDDSDNTVGSGVYILHMQAGGFKEIKKIVVVK